MSCQGEKEMREVCGKQSYNYKETNDGLIINEDIIERVIGVYVK